jgi:biopolymer transport protein ExbB
MLVTRSGLPTPDVIRKLSENSVLGKVLAAGIDAVVAEPRLGEDGLRLAFENAGRSAVHQMERYLNTLGTIAAAAPLMGLFGTVVGMIEIFGSQPATGAANPIMLAHGISVALYNTAFGLIIAIPSLMFYRYFRGRVDEYQLALELAAERMVPHLMRFVVRSPVQA